MGVRKRAKKEMIQYMRKIFFGLFFLYCVLLIEILFLSRSAEPSLSALEYFLAYSNLRPFRTILRYTVFFVKNRDLFSFRLLLFNIGGNFVLFLPMGIFLPVLFDKLRDCRKCFFVILRTILLAELLQGFLRVGIPDVDDFIVNMAGACVGIFIGKNLNGFVIETRLSEYILSKSG